MYTLTLESLDPFARKTNSAPKASLGLFGNLGFRGSEDGLGSGVEGLGIHLRFSAHPSDSGIGSYRTSMA